MGNLYLIYELEIMVPVESLFWAQLPAFPTPIPIPYCYSAYKLQTPKFLFSQSLAYRGS